MATHSVTVVRIYVREGEHLLAGIMQFLHDQEHLAGVTVLRGIAGFASDGVLRTSMLSDLSLDLPLVIEFYDQAERIAKTIAHLKSHFGITHIISWQAEHH